MKKLRYCTGCGVVMENRSKIKYCSNQCQMDYQHSLWLKSWKKGEAQGNVGIGTRIISPHLRRFLLDKFNNKCSLCGWHEINPVTGKVPMEIDHIDGNAENNKEENLRLICPNCHSLTPFFKNLNRGKGRGWRMKNYFTNQRKPIN